MFDDLTELYQQVILDHNKSPRNFRALPDANRTAQGDNPLCGDHVTLYLRVADGRVQDVGWQGGGCAISKASASLLSEALKGKTEAEIRKLFGQVHELVTTGASPENIGKLAVFGGVYKFPARVKCAILPWHAAMAALEGAGQPVTTERADS